MKKTTWKRLMGLMLALVLCLGAAVPTMAMAADVPAPETTVEAADAAEPVADEETVAEPAEEVPEEVPEEPETIPEETPAEVSEEPVESAETPETVEEVPEEPEETPETVEEVPEVPAVASEALAEVSEEPAADTAGVQEFSEEELLKGTVIADYRDEEIKYGNFTKETWTGADNQKMIQVARAQLGRSGSSLGYSEAWCADFVCDVARVAGVSSSVIPYGKGYYSCNVGGMSWWFEHNGATEILSVEDAQPGDIVIFYWSRSKNAVHLPWSREHMDHVAMVVCYDPETKILHYIGGNQNPQTGADDGEKYTNKTRQVTEVVYDTVEKPYIVRIYRPKYNTYDATAPKHKVKIAVEAQGNGTVSGDGFFMQGTSATVTATAGSNAAFVGWYQGDTQVSTAASYAVDVQNNITLTARFVDRVTITANSSGSGTVSGGGTYDSGASVTLNATPDSGKSFTGWYTTDGKELSTSAAYTFTASANQTVCALFAEDYFIDVPANAWYRQNAIDAAERGIVKGQGSPVLFAGNGTFTRAMAVSMIARMVDADVSAAPATPFTDVPNGKWYTESVNWAYANGVTKGISSTEFAPGRTITRQEFLAMLERYITSLGYEIEGQELPFKDKDDVSGWALGDLEKAYARGMIAGNTNGECQPRKDLTRAEGTAFVVRVAKYIEEHTAE